MAKILISLDLLTSLQDLLKSASYTLSEYAVNDRGVALFGETKKPFATITFDDVYMQLEIPGWDYPLDIFNVSAVKEEKND